MAACLIALGSNLGDRAANLRCAVTEIARLPRTRLVARSSWHETPPIGGPAGQGAFLNGSALISTSLAPAAVLAELVRIETLLGRERIVRWDARTLDLDVLVYDDLVTAGTGIEIPHPRMHYRRFVLAPAVEVAPALIHAPSCWTLAALLNQLDHGEKAASIAATDSKHAASLTAQVVDALQVSGVASPPVSRWSAEKWLASGRRPKLLLALGNATGGREHAARKMLKLPMTGPIAWLPPAPEEASVSAALTAIASVWPELALRDVR